MLFDGLCIGVREGNSRLLELLDSCCQISKSVLNCFRALFQSELAQRYKASDVVEAALLTAFLKHLPDLSAVRDHLALILEILQSRDTEHGNAESRV